MLRYRVPGLLIPPLESRFGGNRTDGNGARKTGRYIFDARVRRLYYTVFCRLSEPTDNFDERDRHRYCLKISPAEGPHHIAIPHDVQGPVYYNLRLRTRRIRG